MKNAYCIPLIVWVEYVTGTPFSVMPVKVPVAEEVGTIACRLRLFTPGLMLNANTFPLQFKPEKVELFLPSSHCNIWSDDTTGIPRAWAEATISLAPGPG